MKRRSLFSSPVVWSLSLAACGGGTADRAEAPPPSPAPSASAEPVAASSAHAAPAPPSSGSPKTSAIDVGEELARRRVGGDNLAHQVLYSWTTQAQLKELEGGAPFLSREVSATRGPAAFDDLVSTEAERGRDVAKLLFSQGFAKKRFAWPNAFATVTGEGDGPYGDVLLRVELKKDAWILDYASGTVVGVDGSRGAVSDALAHPERIAAVFFLGNGYREIVLVNESMIARWSAGSAKEVTDALDAEIAFLGAAANAIDEDRAVKPGIPSSTETMLEQGLAFNRKLSIADLHERAKILERVRNGAQTALSKSPETTFVRGRQRIPIAPVCKIVRKDSHMVPEQIGSYVGPKRPVYTPVCKPDNPAVVCLTAQGPQPSDATCTPQPGFGQ